MVCSKSGKLPHLVKIGKHCVAVAEAEKCLEEFSYFYRRSKNPTSITQLLLTGLPKGTGNKGNRVTRKRKQVDVEARVPLSQPEGQTTSIARPSTSSTGHEEQALMSTRFLPVAADIQVHGTPTQWAGQHIQNSPFASPYANPGPLSPMVTTGVGNFSVTGAPTQWNAQYDQIQDFKLCFRGGNMCM